MKFYFLVSNSPEQSCSCDSYFVFPAWDGLIFKKQGNEKFIEKKQYMQNTAKPVEGSETTTRISVQDSSGFGQI